MSSLKEMLVFVNFPGIITGSDEEFNSVISSEHREYLLTWIFEQFHPGESLWTDGAAKSEELAELLYENGFCTSSIKLKFATGDQSLSKELQVGTLKKILNMLILTRNSDSQPAESSQSSETFEAVLKSMENVNIFPDIPGSSRTITEEERSLKIAEYKKEIESLKNEISVLEENEKLNIDYDVSNKEIDLERLERLEEKIVNFKEYMGEISGIKVVECNVDRDGLKLVSGECRNVMENLTEIEDNLQTISNFSESLSLIKNELGKSCRAIEHLVKISREIADMNNTPVFK